MFAPSQDIITITVQFKKIFRSNRAILYTLKRKSLNIPNYKFVTIFINACTQLRYVEEVYDVFITC